MGIYICVYIYIYIYIYIYKAHVYLKKLTYRSFINTSDCFQNLQYLSCRIWIGDDVSSNKYIHTCFKNVNKKRILINPARKNK